MQFYYSEKMPLRILDEGEFWKNQESEHTVVIRQLIKDLEIEFVQALAAWERAFAETRALFVRYIEFVNRSGDDSNPIVYNELMKLVKFSLEQSNQFVQFLNQLTRESEAIKGNQTAIVVMNHIRRESEYFIGIAQALLSHSGKGVK